METQQVISSTKETEVTVTVTDIRKSFGDKDVLKGVDLQIHRGENLVVLGRSGSGKSVLIKLMVGLLKQDAGSINILGSKVEDLTERDLHQLRLKIGFLFQGGALYDGMNVRENLEFSLVRNKRHLSREMIKKAVMESLEDVGLTQTIHQMPSELSGGQKKRIGIARMMILKPEIILYDEPTAGLDPITSVEINNLINKVKNHYNTTSLVITHDLSCAKFTGDRILMLSDGIFIREGSFDEVFNTTDPRIRDFYKYNFIE